MKYLAGILSLILALPPASVLGNLHVPEYLRATTPHASSVPGQRQRFYLHNRLFFRKGTSSIEKH